MRNHELENHRELNLFEIKIENLYLNKAKWLAEFNKNQICIEASQLKVEQIFYLQTDAVVEEIKIYIASLFDRKSYRTDVILFNENKAAKKSSQVKNFSEISSGVDIVIRPGVTDSAAHNLKYILNQKFSSHINIIQSGMRFSTYVKNIDQNLWKAIFSKLESNILLQEVYDTNTDAVNLKKNSNITQPHVELMSLDLDILNRLNKDLFWAFSDIELKTVIEHFKKLNRNPTDVEIEIIAQSWSEHCKHKIFQAEIEYQEIVRHTHKIGNKKISSLFSEYIKKSTENLMIERPWLISVFKDNAGIVSWDNSLQVCIKVETHNSPSALDPYGGAMTGVLGVNRDIMGCGLGARPIANTNVLCFGPLNIPEEHLPKSIKHPENIFQGVHKGIEHAGNKSGIPTVNGSIYFDKSYLGKPLVYCGTVGVMPKKLKDDRKTEIKQAHPGDLIYLVGGGTGKDGIHGATFSSLELNDKIPQQVVQIGDPYTQKLVLDFILEAQRNCLYSSITDNGAGGISSSVGEMAQESGGAHVNLNQVKLKYPGLQPWEITVSESQERMTVAVPKNKKQAFEQLAQYMQVNVQNIGVFNNTGFFSLEYDKQIVAQLELNWLHKGTPQLKLNAFYSEDYSNELIQKHYCSRERKDIDSYSISEVLLNLISSPNITTKEKWVRQFDHEVQAATLIKPFSGLSQKAPSDCAVIDLETHGGIPQTAIALSHGMAPRVSMLDTYLMAQVAVDEAYRNLLGSGVCLDKVCLLDNFCWPDPTGNSVDGHHKAGQLVRCNEGLYDAIQVFKTPLVSGKDSMKNDFKGVDRMNQPVQISVLPTLLITAMGYVQNLERVKPMFFHRNSELIYEVGISNLGLNLSELAEYFTSKHTVWSQFPKVELKSNLKIYNSLQDVWSVVESIHDISDGGLACAVCESMMSETCGVELNLNSSDKMDLIQQLFNESTGRFVVSIQRKNQEIFESAFTKNELRCIGEYKPDADGLKIQNFQENINIKYNEILKHWTMGV